jgi:hypothetical protein
MRNFALIFLALIALCSCEIFGLRDSQPPSEGAVWNDFATNWELTVQNLRLAYTDSRNTVSYSRIFAEDFRFHFAPQDITDFSTDTFWDRAQEQDMLLNLHSRYSKIELSYEALEISDEISADSAKIYRSYEMRLYPGDPEEEMLIASGNLELQLRKEYGYWYITYWYDYRSVSDRTWGRMKHENS